MEIPKNMWVYNKKVEGEVEQYVQEFVELEKYVWGVVYEDGTELHQFGGDMFFHQFKEIQMDKVKMFTVYNSEDMTKRVDLLIRREAQQIFFKYRRHILEVGGEERRETVYMFGTKDKVYDVRENPETLEKTRIYTGHYVEKFYYIFPDGRLIITDEYIGDLLQFNL